MQVQPAPDIASRLKRLLQKQQYAHIPARRIFTFRSFGSTARARARIWAFPRIWQLALNLPPAYIIEVISEKFDHLKAADKTEILIHELTHIPKNFSGSLLPHWRRLFKHR